MRCFVSVIIFICVLCYNDFAQNKKVELEVKEYLLPHGSRKEYKPGLIEFHEEVVHPFREKLGINYTKNNQPAYDSSLILVNYYADPDDFIKPSIPQWGTCRFFIVSKPYFSTYGFEVLMSDSTTYKFYDGYTTEFPLIYNIGKDCIIECRNLILPEDSAGYKTKGKGYSILINGKELNKLYGYDHSFEYHILNGKPFWMFERNGDYGWNFDSLETITDYDSIYHGECCEMGIGNPWFFANEFSFFAQKKNEWYLVVGKIK